MCRPKQWRRNVSGLITSRNLSWRITMPSFHRKPLTIIIFFPDPGRYKYSPERIKKTMSTIDPTVALRSGRRQSEPSKHILKHLGEKGMYYLFHFLYHSIDERGTKEHNTLEEHFILEHILLYGKEITFAPYEAVHGFNKQNFCQNAILVYFQKCKDNRKYIKDMK
ncbi:hypothetical protein AB205_0081000, partial [Aquarana catesbeiana]